MVMKVDGHTGPSDEPEESQRPGTAQGPAAGQLETKNSTTQPKQVRLIRMSQLGWLRYLYFRAT
jgi:hypothetical protein